MLAVFEAGARFFEEFELAREEGAEGREADDDDADVDFDDGPEAGFDVVCGEVKGVLVRCGWV